MTSKRKYIEEKIDLIMDEMPLARDRIESIVDTENIDYVDDFVEKSESLEGFCFGLKSTIDEAAKEGQDRLDYTLDVIEAELYMIQKFSDFMVCTSEFFEKLGK